MNNYNNSDLKKERIDEPSNNNLEFFNDSNFEAWILFVQAGDVVTKAREMELNQFKYTKAQAEILHRLMNNNIYWFCA